MEGFYIGGSTYQQHSYTQKLSKEQEKDIYNFLSIGLSEPSRYRSRRLQLEIQKQRQIKKVRTKILKIFRKIILDKGVTRKISRLLEHSGLSLPMQLKLSRQIRKILLDFARGMHNQLSLDGIKMNLLPLELQRFLVALRVLKAEIVNLFRLSIEGHLQRIKLENENRALMLNKALEAPTLNHDLEHYKSCANTISLTKAAFDGPRGYNFDVCNSHTREKQYRNINGFANTSKKDRNKEYYKRQNKEKYNNKNFQKESKKATYDKDAFYNSSQKAKNY